jgi:hypothetical protein
MVSYGNNKYSGKLCALGIATCNIMVYSTSSDEITKLFTVSRKDEASVEKIAALYLLQVNQTATFNYCQHRYHKKESG